MPFYITSSIHEDPRFRDINPAAIALWVSVGSWRSAYRDYIDWYSNEPHPDWFIPFGVASSSLFGDMNNERALADLIDRGLWEEYDWHDQAGYRMTGEGELWRMTAEAAPRPYIPATLRRAVYDRDGNRCVHCDATDNLSLDHIVPFSLGGQDTYDNFQTLCRSCNSRKGARMEMTP